MKRPDRCLPPSQVTSHGHVIDPGCLHIDSRHTRVRLSHCRCLMSRLEVTEAQLRDVDGLWLAPRCHLRPLRDVDACGWL